LQGQVIDNALCSAPGKKTRLWQLTLCIHTMKQVHHSTWQSMMTHTVSKMEIHSTITWLITQDNFTA